MSDLWLFFASYLRFLSLVRFEVVPIGLREGRCIPHVCLPFLGHFFFIDAFVTGDRHVQLIDPLMSPVIAAFAVLLGPVPRNDLFGLFEVLLGQLRYVFHCGLPPGSTHCHWEDDI